MTETGRGKATSEYASRFPPDYWRLVLEYFDRRSTEVATVDELTAYIHERDESGRDENRIAIYLYHAALPKMATHRYLEFDPRSATARYRPAPDRSDSTGAE